MKMAQGYVTDDGTFFESPSEARLHEAESQLRGTLSIAFPGIDLDKFLAVVFEVRPQLEEYINAYSTAYPTIRNPAEDADGAEAVIGREAEAGASLGHVSSTEEDLKALLKLPSRGPRDVSNVGSGARAEEVPKRREEHGPRVRGADASGVRRSTDMAAEQGSGARPPRPGGGKTHIQKRPVE